MRIVESLKDIKECPNCGNKEHMYICVGSFDREYIFCTNCHEYIYENELTISEEESNTFNIGKAGKAPDDIDDSLMDIEYELGTYEMMASTPHELLMANCMRGILEKFISVIRRMK